MRLLGFDAPFTWPVAQLTCAVRATSPSVYGELKARLPSLER